MPQTPLQLTHDQSGRPMLPPGATPQEIVAWTEEMHRYNAEHPQPSAFEQLGSWFSRNVGTPGSSRQSFPSLGQAPGPTVKPPTVTPPPLRNALTPQRPQQASRPTDINLPQSGSPYPDVQPTSNQPPFDPVGFQTGLRGAQGGNDFNLGNVLMPRANLVDNPYGYEDYGPATPPPSSDSFDPEGNFIGDSTFTSPSGGGGGRFGGLNTQDWLGLAGLGLNAYGQFSNASNQRDQFEQQFGENQRQFNAQLAENQRQFGAQLGQRQAEQGLQATQLNPYAQQQDLFSMAVRRALASGGASQVTPGSPTASNPSGPGIAGAASQFLNDNALANAAGNFERARLQANPGGTPNNLSQTGLGQAGANQDQILQNLPRVLDSPSSSSTPSPLRNALMEGVNTQPQDDSPGFWHQLAHWGLIAAPFVAAPFTGGASLALIGAGAGAADAALQGSRDWRQIALGGALGATAGLGGGHLAAGAARPALAAGLRQAGSMALRNPRLLTSIASSALSHR